MASVLDFIDGYRTGYFYQLGGNGSGGGIDCSNLVYALLKKAGYSFTYTNVERMEASGNFNKINLGDAQPGDLIVYINHHGGNGDHVGVITSIAKDSSGNFNGVFFGSQGSNRGDKGPSDAIFGPSAYYWKTPSYILRPKDAAPVAPPPPVKVIPPLKWSYPVNLKSGSTGFGPAMYFEGLARALGGSFPLGGTGLLHPGIHADLGSAAFIDPKTVLAIADGEIVAYRMDAEPLSVQYPAMSEAVKYSSSFVLIKHQFALPPKPLAPNEVAPTTPAPSEAINLFSLYMHLQDAKAYAEAERNLQKPPYLPVKYQVKASVSKPVMGLRVRDKPGGAVLGIVPLLGKVLAGDVYPAKPKWKKFLGASEVNFMPVANMPEGRSPTVHGYIFIGTLNPHAKVTKDVDSEPSLIAQRVTYIYNQDKATGQKIIANLPIGAVLTLGEKSRHDSSFYAVTSAENLQGFMAPTDTAGKCIGWVDMDDLEEQPFTPPAGVQIVNPPVTVKAGQLIGHPGVFQHHNNGSQQKQLHLELFTPDDLPAFIAKGKSWAQDPNVKTSDKTLVKVPKGKILKAAEVNDAGKLKTPVATPPKIDSAGVALHSDIILPLQALNALPADYKMSLPESDAPDAVKLQWWFLDNVAGQADGTQIKGWLCEKDTTRLSPWSWEGFTTLEDNTPDEKLIAYQLMLANKLRGEELNTYSGIVSEATNWPVIKYLLNTVKDNVVDDVTITDSITPTQLRDANRGYWCAQKLASVAIKTKSEWKKDPARWNALDKILGHTADNPNKNWLIEKSKIEKLSFWDEVSGVVGSSDGKVWGMNPLLLVAYMINFISLEEARVRAFLRMIKVGEGTVGSIGYERLFGGESFVSSYGKDFFDHPRIKITRENKKTGKKYISSASGAYQVMAYTWDDEAMIKRRKKFSINDFTPKSQDRFCMVLLMYSGHGDILEKIKKGETKAAIEMASWTWASLPPSRYGQPIETIEEAIENYGKYLNEELSGVSDLAVSWGDFSDFLS